MSRKEFFRGIFLAILALIIAFVFTEPRQYYPGEVLLIENPDSVPHLEPIKEYGIPVDSFFLESGIIKRNQNLGDLLAQYDISAKKVDELVKAARDVFDLRKIRYGKPYRAYLSKDTLMQLEYFIYEHSPVDYLKFVFNDSVQVIKAAKETWARQREVGVTIESSLWEAMKELDINPIMAVELSEIYAWTIDFFGLQKGDQFKVIFDEIMVDSQRIGTGKIHGAWFRHMEQEIYAIPFVQDSVESYFDQEGNSLRRALLKAPLRYSRISSRYSHSRLHPILKIRRPHHGVDYSAPVGTPVISVGDGKVIRRSYDNANGNIIKIRHNSVYTTAYLHLSRFGQGIAVGSLVKQGDVIGYVGNTGLSTGPHLDYRVYKNGYAVDPLKIEAPPIEPVYEENQATFDSIKRITMSRLDKLFTPPIIME